MLFSLPSIKVFNDYKTIDISMKEKRLKAAIINYLNLNVGKQTKPKNKDINITRLDIIYYWTELVEV